MELDWTKPETNHPFLIVVNNQIAGFVFVKFIKTEERSYNYLAHFFVLRKYRKMGVGRQAAKIIFNSLKGIWELYQLEKNLPAHKFWTNIITELTNGLYEKNMKMVGFIKPSSYESRYVFLYKIQSNMISTIEFLNENINNPINNAN